MKTSPTQRTLKLLRAMGMVVAITEKWNPYARQRQDLFGFIDVLAIPKDRQGLLAVQTTSGDHHADRRKKILGLGAAVAWVKNGNRIWVLSWKMKKRIYEPRIEELTEGDFTEAAETDAALSGK